MTPTVIFILALVIAVATVALVVWRMRADAESSRTSFVPLKFIPPAPSVVETRDEAPAPVVEPPPPPKPPAPKPPPTPPKKSKPAKAEPKAKAEAPKPAPKVEAPKPEPKVEAPPPPPPVAPPPEPEPEPEPKVEAPPPPPPPVAPPPEPKAEPTVEAPPPPPPPVAPPPEPKPEPTVEAPAPPPPPPPPAPGPIVTSTASPTAELEETDKRHKDARRLARLLVSEIKLYNESAVTQGRQNNDLYTRLKKDIDRSSDVYAQRVPEEVRAQFDYLYDELLRQLGEGDDAKLGANAPKPNPPRG